MLAPLERQPANFAQSEKLMESVQFNSLHDDIS